jgi:transposase
MEDKVIMSRKELKRKGVMELVRQGHISVREAGVKLELSYRQTKRVWKRYREQGDGGLVHRARGKATGRGYPAAFKRDVLAYYERSYVGYGPTLASEKLQQREGVKVPAETLRGWLKQAGLWHRQR